MPNDSSEALAVRGGVRFMTWAVNRSACGALQRASKFKCEPKGVGALSVSCMLCRKMICKTACTPVANKYSFTVNAYHFCPVQTAIWQGFEVDLSTYN